MKSLFSLIAIFLCILFGFAQSPTFTVKGEDADKVRLSDMNVDIKVVGNLAWTTIEMVFINETNRDREGELSFPLPEGVSISRYAIDINGKMREAVPVNKSKGKQVFEAIEHRRVDPGLLEKTEGNNFKTRIYPIPPNGKRTVIIAYEEELKPGTTLDALQYQLNSHYPQKLDRFKCEITVSGASNKPNESSKSDLIEFNNWNQQYHSLVEKTNYTLNEKINFNIPFINKELATVMQNNQGQYYFNALIDINPETLLKPLPKNIAIIWDNSLSGLKRNLKKDLELLETYLKTFPKINISVYLLNYRFSAPKNFMITNGDTSEISQYLNSIMMDGGTKYSQVKLPLVDEYLFFTDGLSSLSANDLPELKSPVYTISSSPISDFSYLNFYAQQNGGDFINLNTLTIGEAIKKINTQPLRFLGVKNNYNVTEIYPPKGSLVQSSQSFSGISLQPQQTVTLLFGYGKTATIEKELKLDFAKQENKDVNVEKIWAQKKIANLETLYDKNAVEIETIGAKYNIVTKNTSLIVLESLNDYFIYNILPPAELRPEYDRITKERGERELAQKKSNWENIDSYWTSLNNWWKQDIKFTKAIKFNPKKYKDTEIDSVAVVDSIAYDYSPAVMEVPPPASPSPELQGAVDGVVSANGWTNNESKEEIEEVVVRGYSTASNTQDEQLIDDINEEPLSDSISIGNTGNNISSNIINKPKLSTWNPDRAYLKVLKDTPKEKWYEAYLSLRENNVDNPTFYYDVAQFFYQNNDKNTAYLILSSIADLGLESHQLYKTLTYVLRTWGLTEDAVYTAGQVAKWRDFEPQSYRDLALALEENGKIQEAYDTLLKSLQTSYFGEMSGHYEGFEDIVLMDINRLIQQYGSKINIGELDKKYITAQPVDLRIIMNWNLADTDLDLKVTEPTGEVCYYSHTTTEIGGRFSKDFTRGYGPEQYLLRNAVKGEYDIVSNFYGERALTINGPSTILVEIYERDANGKITKTLHTIQQSEVKSDGALAKVVRE